jgi:8-oxo-dGTP diphosphatase
MGTVTSVCMHSLYTADMRGYEKGGNVAAEITAIREAFARATTAIQASPDAEQAFRDASALGDLAKQLEGEAADFRAFLAARLADTNALSITQLAKLLGMSRSRAAQLVTAGRAKENPVTDPGTEPEPAAVAAAVITSDQGILVARRHDRIPPWTFPAAEIEDGESPAAAAVRAVGKETGLEATADHVIGRRIHPKTGRVMIYLEVTANGTDVKVGDPDLAEVRWIDLAEADQLMPDIFPTVRQHLGRVLGT